MWTAAAIGALLGNGLLPLSDRWCSRSTGTRNRVLAATLLGGVYAALGAKGSVRSTNSAWTFLGFAVLAAIGLLLARVDLAVFRLPDALTLPAYPLVGLPLFLGNPDGLGRAVAAASVCLGGYGLLCALGGLGFGDVKLGGLLGMALGWLSWNAVVIGTVVALILGAVHALVAVAVHRGGRRTPVPYGPAMLAGCLLAVMAAT